jgi:hypothetical protein
MNLHPKVVNFLNLNYCTPFQTPAVSETSVGLVSQFRASAMLLPIGGNWKVCGSDDFEWQNVQTKSRENRPDGPNVQRGKHRYAQREYGDLISRLLFLVG